MVESVGTIPTQGRPVSRPFTYKWVDEFYDILDETSNKYFIRHDVDFSLKKALEFAKFEYSIGIKSNYFILLNGEYYNPFSPESIDYIEKIRQLGHNIQAHIDLEPMPNDITQQGIIIESLVNASQLCGEFESTMVTWHKPATGVKPTYDLVKGLQLSNLIDPNMNKTWKYISDSGMNWREDPINAVRNNKYLHINLHPVWYSQKPAESFEERIHELRLDKDLDERLIREILHTSEYLDKIRKV